MFQAIWMEKLNEFAKRSALDVSICIDIYGVVLPSNFWPLEKHEIKDLVTY